MQRSQLPTLFCLCLSVACGTASWVSYATAVGYLDATGDSLSVAYNSVENGLPNLNSGYGTGGRSCPNGGITGRNWGAELDNPQCIKGSGPVNSFADQINCGTSPLVKVANHALIGATLLGDFKKQANSIQQSLSTQPKPRQVLNFLGHNDICNGVQNKTSTSCTSTNLDPKNYCRPFVGALEWAFRDGLDSLIVVSDTTISILAPARVSQLCRASKEQMCQQALYIGSPNSCANAWKPKALINPSGICQLLTFDCSDERISDAYVLQKSYHDMMFSVVKEYAAIQVNGKSPLYTFNGQTAGGAVKAVGVNLAISDTAWFSQLSLSDISCCDCFHASVAGEQKLADAAINGVSCTASNPCCSDGGSTLNNAKCENGTNGVDTSGTFYSGLLL